MLFITYNCHKWLHIVESCLSFWQRGILAYLHIYVPFMQFHTFSCYKPCYSSMTYTNHVTSSMQADTLICHATMRRNSINFLYNPGHVTLWCVKVGLVANARDGSMQEHDWARELHDLSIQYGVISLFKPCLFEELGTGSEGQDVGTIYCHECWPMSYCCCMLYVFVCMP